MMKKNYKRIILYSADNILNQAESQADIEATEKRREIVISIRVDVISDYLKQLDTHSLLCVCREIRKQLDRQNNSR